MRLTVPRPASPGVSWPEEGGGGGATVGVGGGGAAICPFCYSRKEEIVA